MKQEETAVPRRNFATPLNESSSPKRTESMTPATEEGSQKNAKAEINH